MPIILFDYCQKILKKSAYSIKDNTLILKKQFVLYNDHKTING